MPPPRKILDDPPPLTPGALRNFPYTVRPFPAQYLFAAANLSRLTSNQPLPVPPAPDRRVQ